MSDKQVLGRRPSLECGERYAHNWCEWDAVVLYVRYVAPDDIKAKARRWPSYQGGGLDLTDTRRLATILERALEADRVWDFYGNQAECILDIWAADRRDATQIVFEDIPFSEINENQLARRLTNKMREFAKFLRRCGGFRFAGAPLAAVPSECTHLVSV